ncbi:3-oxoacyl-[acyl-carrier-protein] reductase [Eubacterium xylanophilum]|uniref:3-oxoacyl-[acyl-carrier-protein] reductase n=1 Tax=Eubacterium xylanophilum TaxID=39497 RepID=UPI00047B868F|nr:3-oxoacyl-[acyl-carrier-protein] reductase [Eubacterium xylanophilum]MCR5796435.1 3-oxoacyl-[acyl-carrier-protein] reductase [Eubacterium sp.]
MEDKKLAIVTGGSRGIGRACCERLAKDGFDIVFTYQSNEEAAKETVKLCEKEGVKAEGIKRDVANSDECQKLVDEVVENYGKIDVLVNNAGITRDNLIFKMSDEDFADVVDVNLKGPFYMMRAASRKMNKGGSIINISSYAGVNGNIGQVNYSATKAGIIGMTKSLAKEVARKQITVNAIAPGTIETDMLNQVGEKQLDEFKKAIPMRRIGTPEDIAGAVSFLASDDSNYITGQVLCVNGGLAI